MFPYISSREKEVKQGGKQVGISMKRAFSGWFACLNWTVRRGSPNCLLDSTWLRGSWADGAFAGRRLHSLSRSEVSFHSS